MLVDALAPKVARTSPGMVLAVRDKQHTLFQSHFYLLELYQIQDTIENENIYFVIFKPIQHVKSWYISNIKTYPLLRLMHRVSIHIMPLCVAS